MTAYPPSSMASPAEGAQGVLDSLLLPDEQVIHVAAISPMVYWKAAAITLVAVMAVSFSVNLAAYLLLISLGMFLLAFCTRKYLLLAATDRRLLIRSGVLSLETIQFAYDTIESVELSSMLLGQLFGYANVIITGTGRRRVYIPYVENAAGFEASVTQRILERKRGT